SLPASAGRGREPSYSIGRPHGLGPRGKALSSAAISASLSDNFPAAALSAACSALDAFGIASTDGARVRNASATWRAVALCASAMACSTSPPLLRADGNSLWPNGEYATTATPCCSHQGTTACSIARSCR